jgi:hypothetical protein
MPPRGGPRIATRIQAVNENNPDDIRIFDSLTATADGLEAKSHHVITRALKNDESVNGYKVSVIPADTINQLWLQPTL